MSWNFCLSFNFFVPKAYVFESFRQDIISLDFVGFPFKISKLKNALATLNTSFHIDLGRFAGD